MMKHKDTILAIAAVIGLVAFIFALFLTTGCGGADFNAISTPDSSSDDPGPRPAPLPFAAPHDAGMLSDTVEAETSSVDSSNADGPSESTVSDTMPDVVEEAEAACTPLTHPNGLGQLYLDCAPLGTPGDPATYSLTMAMEAATAAGSGSGSVDPNCGGPGTSTCWYQGSGVWCIAPALLAGRVGMGQCPIPTSATWN